MKLIDGIKLTGDRVQIPDCSRDDLPQFFKDVGFSVGAEIGVFRGEFMEKFCQVGLEMYAVDPWIPYRGFDRVNEKRIVRQEELYQETVKRLAPYGNAHIVRKKSLDALEDFVDESLDFVYIDGNHNFRYVADDLVEWSKKVRKGGIVSGHDYAHFGPRWDCHVRWVVDAYVRAFRITPLYILGSSRIKKGELRDRFRSWMFFRQ